MPLIRHRFNFKFTMVVFQIAPKNKVMCYTTPGITNKYIFERVYNIQTQCSSTPLDTKLVLKHNWCGQQYSYSTADKTHKFPYITGRFFYKTLRHRQFIYTVLYTSFSPKQIHANLHNITTLKHSTLNDAACIDAQITNYVTEIINAQLTF